MNVDFPVSKSGCVMHLIASLLWIPQAALLAWAIQRLCNVGGVNDLIPCATGFLLVGLIRAALEAYGAGRIFDLARSQLSDLRRNAIDALATRSPLDRMRPSSGLAASLIAEQAEAMLPYLIRYRPARWRVMIVMPMLWLAVASLSWAAALALLITAPLIPIFMIIVGWRAKAASDAHMLEMGDMNAFLLDRLRGLVTLRALGAVEATVHQVGVSAHSLRERTMAVLRIAFLSSAVMEFFSALGVAMVAVYIGFHLLGHLPFGAWGQKLALEQGMFILLLAPAFFDPLRDFSSTWHDRAAGAAAAEALVLVTEGGMRLPGTATTIKADAMHEHAPTKPPTLAIVAGPAVRINGLTFAYPGRQLLFENYHLNIFSGEHVALAGGSGAGKTTLLSLIAGLMPTEQGDIVIGGVKLEESTAALLRSRMAWLSQKPHIFSGSIRTNALLGRTDSSPEHLDAVLRFVGLDGLLKMRSAATFGEGGVGLSGGEAIRLALARAVMLPHAGLLLVDEPTAHLDKETAAQVAEALMTFAIGKTLIVATHDPILMSRVHRVIRCDANACRQAA